jgi:predicted N-acetyltransferase YhbS
MDRRLNEAPDAAGAARVRVLRASDLAAVVALDQRLTGRSRRSWYEARLHRALRESDLNLSLGAEREGQLVGALLAEVHHGEFGQAAPVAVLDTVLVDPRLARQGVGRALLDQLLRNLEALRVASLRTEVSWAEQPMIQFLAACGFAPAPRLVLERAVLLD